MYKKNGKGERRMSTDNIILSPNTIPLTIIKEIAKKEKRLVYAISTCWWKLGNPVYTHPENSLPCDPRGSMLMETDKPLDFILEAEKNPSYYGKHGLNAFTAAYHGNIITKDKGFPTSLNSWNDYNKLLDQQTVE